MTMGKDVVPDGHSQFEVQTTVGPVNVTAATEAEALITAREHVGGRALSAKVSQKGDKDAATSLKEEAAATKAAEAPAKDDDADAPAEDDDSE